MSMHRSSSRAGHALAMALTLSVGAGSAQAFTIVLDSAAFSISPTFNNVLNFSFSIDVAGPLAPGVYNNPTLGGVNYSVQGALTSPTPSGFPAFLLQRAIGGAEFYAQGSSLSFEIRGDADLSDGLQLGDLASSGGSTPVFTFNGRELGTGRYHPALLTLTANGTGTLQNSNNMGGVNSATGHVVDVAIGAEYVVEIAATQPNLTLSPVPEPTTALFLALGLAGLGGAGLARSRSRRGLQLQAARQA